MKVKIYSSANKEKTTTLKIENDKQLKNLYLLAKTELFRKDILADMDYNEVKLCFKIDGEKATPAEIVEFAAKHLGLSDSDNKDKDKKGKKKKKKKGSKESKKEKDEKSKKDSKKKKKKGKKSGKKDGKSKTTTIEDGFVQMTRIRP